MIINYIYCNFLFLTILVCFYFKLYYFFIVACCSLSLELLTVTQIFASVTHPLTLTVGLVLSHPTLFYISVFLFIFKFCYYASFFLVVTVAWAWFLLFLTLYLGMFWGLFSDIWSFFWVSDVIEWSLLLFSFFSIVYYHVNLGYKNYKYSQGFIIFWVIFMCSLRFGIIWTRHSFFSILPGTLFYFVFTFSFISLITYSVVYIYFSGFIYYYFVFFTVQYIKLDRVGVIGFIHSVLILSLLLWGCYVPLYSVNYLVNYSYFATSLTQCIYSFSSYSCDTLFLIVAGCSVCIFSDVVCGSIISGYFFNISLWVLGYSNILVLYSLLSCIVILSKKRFILN